MRKLYFHDFMHIVFRFYKRLLSLYGRYCLSRKRNFIPCVIVPISGGIGNQIWSYSIGAGVALFSGLPVKYDLTWYRTAGRDINEKQNRNFDLLKIFPNINIHEATRDEIQLYRKYFCYSSSYTCKFDRDVYYSRRPRYLHGFYAHSRYLQMLDKSFWNQFEFCCLMDAVNQALYNKIKKTENAIAVHIRKGDYMGSIHDVVTPDYYHNAMSFLEKMFASSGMTFFIFSDDMLRAKQMFGKMPYPMVFVEHNSNDNAATDMYLMSCCHHYIIANSTFSWIAAWLGRTEQSIVIMPDRWFSQKAPHWVSQYSEDAFYVEGYIKMACRT